MIEMGGINVQEAIHGKDLPNNQKEYDCQEEDRRTEAALRLIFQRQGERQFFFQRQGEGQFCFIVLSLHSHVCSDVYIFLER